MAAGAGGLATCGKFQAHLPVGKMVAVNMVELGASERLLVFSQGAQGSHPGSLLQRKGTLTTCLTPLHKSLQLGLLGSLEVCIVVAEGREKTQERKD